MWFDTRYMHKEISDTRYIELQIKIVERNVKDYHRMVESGETPSPREELDFEMDKDQLKFLMNERNKILGIGDLPQ